MTTNFPESKIIITANLEEIHRHVVNAPLGTVVFLDVDDTIITPKSSMFRKKSPSYGWFDDLKKNRHLIPDSDDIISHWRLTRRIQYVDPRWPEMISTWKERVYVHGLTKMDTGSLGQIPSMETWRYEELSNLDITFNDPQIPEGVVIEGGNPATLYKGIFFTGSHGKGDVLHSFLKRNTPPLIIVVDDREEQVRDVMSRSTVPTLGIHFTASELIPCLYNPDVVSFQQKTLLEKKQWIEDKNVASNFF